MKGCDVLRGRDEARGEDETGTLGEGRLPFLAVPILVVRLHVGKVHAAPGALITRRG